MTAPIRLLTVLFVVLSVTSTAAETPNDRLAAMASSIDARLVPTGILYDRVVPLTAIESFDGSADSPSISTSKWLQAFRQLRGAHLREPSWPDAAALRARGKAEAPRGSFSIAIVNSGYNRLGAQSLDDGTLRVIDGRLVVDDPRAIVERRLFAVSALRDVTARGGNVSFSVRREHVFSDEGLPERVVIDFDDGVGEREVSLDERINVSYAFDGRKHVRVAAYFKDTVRYGAFSFGVAQVAAPAPNDTMQVTASIDYQGQFGSGEAYVYLAPNRTVLTSPVIVVEGFDLDNSMNWDELYLLLNDENLIEDIRAQGFDAVVLNFADATDYIQKNAFVVLELIQQVQNMVFPHTTVGLVGASMGGLCSRYALAYMESNTLPHRVRTFISFDSPQSGAVIPLGVQYWVAFFSELSTDAAALQASLDSPAARQMLIYHYTDPAGTTGEVDPLRTALEGDFAAVGEYPSQPRLVAIANGPGDQSNQGLAPGAQIIDYDTNAIIVQIRGHVWALPDGVNTTIFDGEIDYLIGSDSQQLVQVSGTLPWDGAPGGWRNSMQQMDETSPPFGDIVALHNNHCFIPTISALDLNVSDPFYDIDGEANLLALSPFDATYYLASNTAHVDITPENKAWVESELSIGVVGIEPPASARATTLRQNHPNPFNPSTTIRFDLARMQAVTLTVHDVAGRLVRTLVDGVEPSGPGEVRWDGLNESGNAVASGVYMYRLRTANQLQTRKMVLLK